MANDYFNHVINRVPWGVRAVASQVNNIGDEIQAGFAKLPEESELKNTIPNLGVDSGIANAYIVTQKYPVTAYTDGMRIYFKPLNTSTGASTVAVDGLAPTAIIRPDNTPVNGDDIIAGIVYEMTYNGTSFVMSGAAAALGAATEAEASAVASALSETNAGLSEAAALASETAAAGFEAGAETARDFASQWASEAQDVAINDGVNPTNYSAYHWALAAQAAASSLVYKGLWDPTTLAYPVGPYNSGDLWIIDTDGTFDTIDWHVGDWLIRNANNDGWEHVVRTTDWHTLQNIPSNVVNALSTLGGTVTGAVTFEDNGTINTANPNWTYLHTGASGEGRRWDSILLNADNSFRFRAWNAAEDAVARQYIFNADGRSFFPGDLTITSDWPNLILRSSNNGEAQVIAQDSTGQRRMQLFYDYAAKSCVLRNRDTDDTFLGQVSVVSDGNIRGTTGAVPADASDLTNKGFLEDNFPTSKPHNYGKLLATTSQTTTQWMDICSIALTGAYASKQLTFDLVSRFHNQRITVEAEVNSTNTGYAYVRITNLALSTTIVANVVAWVNTFGVINVACEQNAYSGATSARVIVDECSADSGAVTWSQDNWSVGKPAGTTSTHDGLAVWMHYTGTLRYSGNVTPSDSNDLATVGGSQNGEYCNLAGYPLTSTTTLNFSAIGSSWVGIGPTGSGAVTTWAALDGVPTDANWAEIKLVLTGTTTSASSNGEDAYRVYCRSYGSSTTQNNFTLVAWCGDYILAGNPGQRTITVNVKVPLDSANRFMLSTVNTWATSTVGYAYLVGWGYNAP